MQAGAQVASLGWPEVQRRAAAGATAVLPIGASAKSHGHHLPLASDALQADWLGAALAARHPVLVWPTLTVGHYPAFVDYPGSISLSAQTFQRLLREVSDSILRHVPGPLLIVNTGISTIAGVDAVVAAAGGLLRAAHVYRGGAYARRSAELTRQRHGGHGDEAETAIMLAIAPDRVRMSQARCHDHPPGSGPLSRTPGTASHTPQGVWGDPTRASAATGQALLAAMLTDLADALRADGPSSAPPPTA